jgi:isopentenyl diphosphate isomerase/L-lactate dehydrogenase-like FMN-dependent dehydrogenase
MEGVCNLRELEARAQAVLPAAAFGYYRSGADDERTLRDNEAAFRRWTLRPRVLVDVSAVDTRVTLLGRSLASPVLVAPMAGQRMAHAEGELASARAAAAHGAGFVLSTLSTCSLEAVAAQRAPGGGGAPQYFQLYVFRERAVTEALVRRAEAAGYAAVVVTADAPFLGRREADVRSAFSLPAHLTFANLARRGAAHDNNTDADTAAGLGSAAHTSLPPRALDAVAAPEDGSALAAYFVAQIDPSLTWDVVAWLKSVTTLPVLVKGVLTAEDASAALHAGADGVVVSNHGGRQLDGALAALDALPEVVSAVAGRAPVLVDGGVRRGSDVLTALALGATAVLLGRPVLYGLALGGQEGAGAVLGMLHRELRLAMALSGVTALPPPRELLRRAPCGCGAHARL